MRLALTTIEVEGEGRMLDVAILWDWLSFAVRWLHVITGIAWIGSSFYFVALDLGLRQRPGLPAGAWRGMAGSRRRLLHIQKYLCAGRDAGASHLVQVGILRNMAFGLRAALHRLLRRRGSSSSTATSRCLAPVGILISLATIGVGWIVYDSSANRHWARATPG